MLATLDSSERVFRNANKKHPEFRQPNKKRSSFSVILRYELSWTRFFWLIKQNHWLTSLSLKNDIVIDNINNIII